MLSLITNMYAIPQASQDVDSRYHGFLLPKENVANVKHGATVVRGDNIHPPNAVLTTISGIGFAQHVIGDDEGIVIKLGQQCFLNHIRMLLWKEGGRSYSYCVEVSRDQLEWVKICDHTRYDCQSWQRIYFPVVMMRYIKIVGTKCSLNDDIFRIVSMQAYFTTEEYETDHQWNLIMPDRLSDWIRDHVRILEGSCVPDHSTEQDLGNKITLSHRIGYGAIVIQLAQPFLISSMRFLLDVGVETPFSYYIEVSKDGESWQRVWDKSEEKCGSWQAITFSRVPVVYIKIVGTKPNLCVFTLSQFECPSSSSNVN